MTESPDATAQSTTVAEPTRYRDADPRDRRLHRTLAWVGIVAGVVFTVAVIFFSGVAVGRSTGYGWHRGYHHSGQMAPGGGCPMMGGMMGPGGRMDPDERGPGMMRPGQPPAPSSAPVPPTPR